MLFAQSKQMPLIGITNVTKDDFLYVYRTFFSGYLLSCSMQWHDTQETG